MKEEKVVYVTCDLLRPMTRGPYSCQGEKDLNWITGILDKLGIKNRSIWKEFSTPVDSWLSQECTLEITKPYLELIPDLFRSASCVVGWGLPAGLRQALESEEILWVSFTRYLWGHRKDLLAVESSSSWLLEAIHQPLPRIQPIWTLDDHLRTSSLLIVEPPASHDSRIRNGKLHSLNDCVDRILEFGNLGKEMYVFPNDVVDTGNTSLTLSLLGLHPLNTRLSCFAAYLASDRVTEVASVDPSLIHITQSFQKPFHCWNPQQGASALISLRCLKAPSFWDKILNQRAQ
ncbi:MAG: hypothetical protein C5B47_05585 [Verrucomicrobia bacterium]|nr:MAG: hypothetical protein C5B47_05585 [Verrucomicrobiota bacterium]